MREEMVTVLNICLFIVNFDYLVLLHLSAVGPVASQGSFSSVSVRF